MSADQRSRPDLSGTESSGAELPDHDDEVSGTYLDEMLETLWPGATFSSPTRFAKIPSAAADFIIVPSRTRPKLVLPRRPRRATAAALRNYKTSATGRTRARLRLLSTMTRLGLAEVLPDRVRVERGPATRGSWITDYLRDVLEQDLLVSLYIGPPRAVQKPVLQLLTPAGRTFGFAKVGVNALTRDLVRAEAASLTFLAGVSLSELRVPEVLHHGQCDSQEVLVLAAVPPPESGRLDHRALVAAGVELASVRGVSTCLLALSAYWNGLHARLLALPSSDLVAGLIESLDAVAALAQATKVTFGSWHGDWAPWNMTSTKGRVSAWDWEQFETGVPVGFDAVHFHVQSAVVVDGADPAAAFESAGEQSPALLAPFGVASHDARLIVFLYLVEIATRYLHDGEVEVDATSMGRLNGWLLETLRLHTSRLVPAARG